MPFLGQSQPYCSLVGSENPFLTSQIATNNYMMLNNVMQITKVAKEHCKNKHAAYIHHIGKNYVDDQLIFVAESVFDQCTSYHGYGWALKGQHALCKSFFMQGKRYLYFIGIETHWLMI